MAKRNNEQPVNVNPENQEEYVDDTKPVNQIPEETATPPQINLINSKEDENQNEGEVEYIVVGMTISHSGTRYEDGDTIKLSDEFAEKLKPYLKKKKEK
jgi:hypothetical protein